jgi:F0F1-type ATP synthase membrane subunit b/b'
MKKIFTILLTASLFLGLSTNVFAATDKDHAKGLQLIEKANVKIDKKIEQAVKDADKLQEKYLSQVAKPNAEIDQLTTKYNEELDKIIDSVYDETLKISTETITKAEEFGIIGVCSWVLVEFADRSVWIDPIKVVGMN